MNTLQILTAARQGNPEPARLLYAAIAMKGMAFRRPMRLRQREWCARIAEQVALGNYGGARNLVREAKLVMVQLPKAYLEI